MRMLRLRLAIAGAAGILLLVPMTAQVSRTVPKAAKIRIINGPEMERTDPEWAIVTWTVNNPGGTPVHYGVVHYGTSPQNLGQLAKSPIRLNQRGAPTSVFRVRVYDLKPKTTYYYTISSTGSDGSDDGVKSTVRKFTTPPQETASR